MNHFMCLLSVVMIIALGMDASYDPPKKSEMMTVVGNLESCSQIERGTLIKIKNLKENFMVRYKDILSCQSISEKIKQNDEISLIVPKPENRSTKIWKNDVIIYELIHKKELILAYKSAIERESEDGAIIVILYPLFIFIFYFFGKRILIDRKNKSPSLPPT